MREIVIVIDSEFVWRSYFQSGLIQSLNKKYLVDILFVNVKPNDAPINVKYVKTNLIINFITSVNSYAYWKANSSKSQSFQIRILSVLKRRRLFFSNNKDKSNLSISAILGIILGSFKLRLPFFLNNTMNLKLLTYIKKNDKKCFIYPTIGGPLSLSDFFTYKSIGNRIDSIICLENWDNISSKAVFHLKPKKILVWGEQAAISASFLHKIPVTNIYEAGSPRIEFTLSQLRYSNTNMKLKVLFAGGSQDYEQDLFWVHEVHKWLDKKFDLIYLPHPINYKFLNSSCDMKLLDGVKVLNLESNSAIVKDKQLPKLDSYHEILNDIFLIISPLSTMSLEALIYGKLSIGIDFSEEMYFQKRKKIWWATEVFEHYFGLGESPNFVLIKKPSDLLELELKSIKFVPEKIRDYFYNPAGFEKILVEAIQAV